MTGRSRFWGQRLGTPDRAVVLALGARGGIAGLVGTPANPVDVAGERIVRPWAGPAATARACLTSGFLVVTATVELGFALLGAQGTTNPDTAVAVRGMWMAASAGAGFRY